jgi:hypothetical protein
MLRILGTLLLVVLVALVIVGCVSETPTHYSDSPWEGDLDVIETKLPRLHKNLFHALPEDEFHAGLDALRRRLPELTDVEIQIGLRRIFARIGDPHTDLLTTRPEAMLPFTLYDTEEGLAVIAATDEYRELLGNTITAVEGTPIVDVIQELSQLIPHENQSQLRKMYPNYLLMPDYLKALGLVTDPEAVSLTVRTLDGAERTYTVRPVATDSNPQFVRYVGGVLEVPAEVPVYLKNAGEPYWFTYDEEAQLVYIGYHQCRSHPDKPFDAMARQIYRVLDERPVTKVVVDLRRNGGGSSVVLNPLIRRLAKDTASERYELYTFIGRRTFSSAVLNAIDLQQKAGAILVGEPTGGSPNHYGEVRSLKLPHSGLTVTYSTKYFRFYRGEDANALYPDIEAASSLRAYRDWVDPAMRAIGESPTAPMSQ